MADSEDMKLLASGELDLSRCDFREADLSGMDLSGRNFSHSLLQKSKCHNTNFSGSNFAGAQVSFIKASNANFNGCNLRRLHFGYPELSGSTMREVSGIGAIFQHANLDNVDMRGADFSSGSVDADTSLNGIIADMQTKFDGLKLLRPTSRDRLFQDYEFKNGELHRRAANVSDAVERIAASASVPHSDGTRFSDGTGYAAPASDRIVQFNHNDPEYQSIAQSFDDAIEAIRATNEHIDGKEGALQSLQYAGDLWRRFELSVTLAKVGIVMAIDDALNLVGKAAAAVAIEAIKASVVDYIRRNLQF